MNTIDYYDELDDNDLIEHHITKQARAKHLTQRNPKKIASPLREFVNAQDDSRSAFKFTYKAARFEQGWLLNSLGEFYEHKWISDVIKRVKGGKEASVYLCHAGAEVDADLIAAKVYRPRSLRNLKNDHAYRDGRENLDGEGKTVLDDGMQHAMDKRTEYGKNLLHQSWIAYEFTSMQTLRAAGASVPRPLTMAGNAILMSYIGDLDSPAPALNEISLDRADAHRLFGQVLANFDILLAQECVHGDLSAYNILLWEGDITFIDFPQVVSPKINRNAFSIFQRDVTRVCEYFARQRVNSNPRKIAADLWAKYGYKINSDVDVRLLDADDPKDRDIWQKQKR